MKKSLILLIVLLYPSVTALSYAVGTLFLGTTKGSGVSSIAVDSESAYSTGQGDFKNSFNASRSWFDPKVKPDVGAYEYGAYERNTKSAPVTPPTPSWTSPTVQGGGNTYYLREDGTAVNKASATGPGTVQANCMNVAVHNGETFGDGDIIYINTTGGGGSITGRIIPPSSGSDADNQISYLGDGVAVMDGGGAEATAIQVSAKSHLFFEHINITDYTTYGFYQASGTTVTIVDCDVSNVAGSNDKAIFLHSAGANNLYIYECDIGTSYYGLHTAGTGVVKSYGCNYHDNVVNWNVVNSGGIFSYDDTMGTASGTSSVATGVSDGLFDGLTMSGHGRFYSTHNLTIRNADMTTTSATDPVLEINHGAGETLLCENVTIHDGSNWGFQSTGTLNSVIFNDCTFDSNTGRNVVPSQCTTTFNFCTFDGGGVTAQNLYANGSATFNDCNFTGSTLNEVYGVAGNVYTFNRCLFTGTGTDHVVETNNTYTYTFNYCIFDMGNVDAGDYGIYGEASGTLVANNCVFYDDNDVSSGMYMVSATPTYVWNTIFQNLAVGVTFNNSPTAYVDYCFFYENDNDVTSTGVLGGNCSQGTDPKMVSPGTDYYLQSDSTCINAGIDVDLYLDYDKTQLGVSRWASDYATEGSYTIVAVDGSANEAEGYIGETGTGETIEAAKGLTGITKANPGVITFNSGHGYIEGDLILLGADTALTEMTELNGAYVNLLNPSGDTFEIWDTSGYTSAETTGGNCAQRISVQRETGVDIYTDAGLTSLGWTETGAFDYNGIASFTIYN